MIFWGKHSDSMAIIYPNGYIVTVRRDPILGYVDLDVTLQEDGFNVNRLIHRYIYGSDAELPFGFANIDAEKLTKILVAVSNLPKRAASTNKGEDNNER